MKGTLIIRSHELFIRSGDQVIHLDKEVSLEVHMGSCWIEGRVQPEYNLDNEIASFHFRVNESEDFCGLIGGMYVRLSER